jgi:phage terminase Nu1 subunit (DNA packaging protein)
MTVVTGEDGTEGVTFEAFARIIGKSRPYVSKLVKDGRITAPALTPDRKIIPDLAKQHMAEGADPARRGAAVPAGEADSTYASQRARMVAAQAERAELDLQERRGELIQRTLVADVIGGALRKLRDDLVAVPRDIVLDPGQAAQCEEAITAALERASVEILNHGGGSPAQ